eukprot:7786003-Alexandrium_andersonii.AAC.1
MLEGRCRPTAPLQGSKAPSAEFCKTAMNSSRIPDPLVFHDSNRNHPVEDGAFRCKHRLNGPMLYLNTSVHLCPVVVYHPRDRPTENFQCRTFGMRVVFVMLGRTHSTLPPCNYSICTI